MKKTKIKICGITSPADAVACDALGADYLGVVFSRSPRHVTPERARQIRQAVPGVNLVGVFSDAEPDTVVDIVRFSGLNTIQLNGNESPAYCKRLLALTLMPIIKTFRKEEAADIQSLFAFETASFFLFDLDSSVSNRNGAMHKLWADADRARRKGYRIFLAGGLEPSNVREALSRTSPFCVDACGGVEMTPGAKDIEAVKRFIEEVRGHPLPAG